MAMALPTTALSQPGQASPPLQQIDGGPAVPVSPYFSHLIAGDDQQGVLSGVAFPLVSRLKPGVLRQPAAVLAVPQAAVFQKQGLYYAFALEGDKAVRYQVEIGDTLDDWIEIKSGLREQTPVINANVNKLKDGDTVQVAR